MSGQSNFSMDGLNNLINQNVIAVCAPLMSQSDAEYVIAWRENLGAHPGECRGVGQSELMDEWPSRPGGEFFGVLRDHVSGFGSIENKFMALNSGVTGETSLRHVDKPLGLLREPTHRFVFNYNNGGGAVGLAFRFKYRCHGARAARLRARHSARIRDELQR